MIDYFERSSILSKFVRNVSLYLLIIIVAVSIIDAFTTNKADKSEISYTNFMNQVQQKKVDAVQITDDHAIVGRHVFYIVRPDGRGYDAGPARRGGQRHRQAA